MTRPQKVKRVHLDTGEFVIFDSLVDAEKGTPGASKPNICKCLSGQLKKHAEYIWERVSDVGDNSMFTEWKEYPDYPDTLVANTGQVKVKGVLRKTIKDKRCQNVFIYLDKVVLLWKIVAATYFSDQFNPKSRNCDFKDGNSENCSVDNLILNPPPKPRKIREELSEKVCTICNNLLGVHLFSENRNACNSCRRQRNHERESVTKTCSECKQTGESNTFHGSKCNKCTWKQKVEKNQLKDVVGVLPKECIKCHTTTSDFQFRQELNAYRNVCVSCIKLNNQEKQYWKAWRLKQRTFNEDSFLKRNAEVHREWIRNNPDVVKRYTEDRARSPEQKITQILNYAVKKKISINEDDVIALKHKLSTPCSFCGYLDLDVRVNTLVLINYRLGYSDANTISACTTCSNMKHTNSISKFLGYVFDIVAHNNLDTTDLPITRTLPPSKWTCNGHTDGHEYNKKIDSSKYNYLKDYPCYLCGISPSDATPDRVDSTKPYTTDNVKACCKNCNYLKKDFDLTEFLNHLAYIFNKCYSQRDLEIYKDDTVGKGYQNFISKKNCDDGDELSYYFKESVVLGHDSTNDNTKTTYKRPRPRGKWVEHPLHYRVLVYSTSKGELLASYPSMKECASAIGYSYTGITTAIKERYGIICDNKYRIVTVTDIEEWKKLSEKVSLEAQEILEKNIKKLKCKQL